MRCPGSTYIRLPASSPSHVAIQPSDFRAPITCLIS